MPAEAPAGADLPALLRLAEAAARAAGALLRDGRPEDLRVEGTKSSATDVVTQMDTAAEALLMRLLLRERPDDGFLGEESGLVEGTSGLTWVVDPIDGTVNYLYGLPLFAVSVAAVAGPPADPGGWRVLAGVVHAPALDETWTATLGAGAYLNGRPLRLRPPPALPGALVGTGFGYTAESRERQGRWAGALLPQVRDLRRLGSAALDLCAVATGRYDAYYEQGLKPWDLAAAGLVAAEAGAEVTGLRGAPPGEDMVVCAAPGLSGELREALVAAGA